MKPSQSNDVNPGPIVLFGSGETSPSGRKVFERVLRHLPMRPRLALLETPAGFELNSAQVIGRVGEFLVHRLQNYQPQVEIVAARQRGTPFSPDDPQIVAPLLSADLIFMGPGSPSYAVRQLRDSLAWQYLLARHRLGAALVLASAAAIAVSTVSLPVYEIYKVGEDLHWVEGLDLFGAYGLSLAIVSHWDNKEGGAELDTRYGLMGRERFQRLLSMLPEDVMVVGIDEHTALVMDLEAGECRVMGRGGVTLVRDGKEASFPTGESFAISELGPFRLPAPAHGIPRDVWEQVLAARSEALQQPAKDAPQKVLSLVEEREAARARRDWGTSDELRDRIADLGWQIRDTAAGPEVLPL